MNFERSKTSFIYSVRKQFLQKNRHPYIGTVGRLILPFYLTVKFTCIISCISGHLTEPLPLGDVAGDSLSITSWISKTFLQLKGWLLKKQRDRGPPLVISGISGISFFNFLNCWNYYILFKIFPEVHTIPNPTVSPPLKYQIFFRCLH